MSLSLLVLMASSRCGIKEIMLNAFTLSNAKTLARTILNCLVLVGMEHHKFLVVVATVTLVLTKYKADSFISCI